ncbi:FAD:protein FMN transferase [Sphingobacterium sp. Mn56C]|uniref:FAD:protein FMN transferase n=1 Tax=Sphingobacterium sp. Mn56C TaxID=3395261 RepID=UPI003BE7ACFF
MENSIIKRQVILAFFILILPFCGCAQVLQSRQTTLMGSVFEITIVAQDSTLAQQHISAVIDEIERIENLISEWRPHTQISEVNRNAGIRPIKVDKEVFDLTARAIAYAEMTHGAFDISIIAMDKIWSFDGSMDTLPTAEAVQQSVQNVGYKFIILDSIQQTIFLSKKGMKIGFGSIGKGYAADMGRALMLHNHIPAGIVNASGDIATWGTQPNGKPWAIGINNPFKNHRILKTIKLTDGAIATSGSYEKYAEINGKRYAHIINPKTGYPATGITSVTIYGPSAEYANALSTSVMVLGLIEGTELLKKNPTYKYVIQTDQGKVKKN